MSGDTALKYVRSRHATGAEGSDFSRNQRQQAVMKSIRAKVLSSRMLLNPRNLEGLYKTLDHLVQRDITNEQGAQIAKNIVLKRKFTQVAGVLPRELFTVPDVWQYNGQYVLVPTAGGFTQVHKYVEDLLHEKDFLKDK
ncbi:LCP family protein [Candidatus Microgenomates bacterium]|nr:LCP family protein [Candidatus Microgenomates bacterium]